ncbi:MAG: bifunctional (p)ppGpp synthetase/guanosine-3',5'-bis(diphosphate) 3'-pyrophosphohydrolase [Anaerolineales bacterium]|nr:bifunctional (p)ppGpp synthetase/guanosine-3',5'-bis(diphosphate) 3'-pyrophosphohydrolase [Anaerolineales bacterium]
MSQWSPDRLQKAWRFAARYHEGQTYGGANEGERIDYLVHIGSVAMEVAWGLTVLPLPNPDLAIQCALLHDTLEDTAATYDQLRTEFGAEVADGVQALTKNSQIPNKAEQMADSLRRIQTQPYEVWLVKLADRITNLQAPPYYWDRAKIGAYRAEGQQIYDALHPAHAPLAARLAAKIDQYQQFL